MDDRTAWKDGGAWLRGLRTEAGITERELAEQIGAPTARLIEEFETGRAAVPAAFYRGYARSFDMSLAAFAARCAEFYGPGETAVDAAA